MIELTVVYEQTDDWWIGWVEEIPGANVQEQTLEEARSSLAEAVELILEANRSLSRASIGERHVIRESVLPIAS